MLGQKSGGTITAVWARVKPFEDMRARAGSAGMAVQDFRYLPPTSANLALLRVPIPAGYPRR